MAAAHCTVTLRQAEALVGLPYIDGDADCMHLAVRAQSELFGRTVNWPARRHPRGVRGQVALVERHLDELAVLLVDDDIPASGDAVLWTADDDAGKGLRYHIGTLLVQASEMWVLHTNAGLGESVLQRLVECPAQGLRLEGIYRWRA